MRFGTFCGLANRKYLSMNWFKEKKKLQQTSKQTSRSNCEIQILCLPCRKKTSGTQMQKNYNWKTFFLLLFFTSRIGASFCWFLPHLQLCRSHSAPCVFWSWRGTSSKDSATQGFLFLHKFRVQPSDSMTLFLSVSLCILPPVPCPKIQGIHIPWFSLTKQQLFFLNICVFSSYP